MQPVGPAHLLNHKAAERLNLAVLKRMDSATEEVLASANHVALYDFDQSENHWVRIVEERKDVEGSLFLIRRNAEPFVRFIILNKKSNHNYVEDVVPGFQFEKTRPYLLYRNTADKVVGIWFYEAKEADKVEALLGQVTAAHAAAKAQWQQQAAAASGPEACRPAAMQVACTDEDGFWDQQAASAPSRPLQPDMPVVQQERQEPAGRQAFESSIYNPQNTGTAAGTEHVHQQMMDFRSLPVSSLPHLTAPQLAPPAKHTLPVSATPSRAPAVFKGVNGLQQGAAMTPEQSNLAKLLSNMRMASSGAPASMLAAVQAEEQQQKSSPSGTAASAPFATVPSDSLQTPLFLQSKSTVSGRSSVTVESGRQYQAAQATARPALLPPNFFTGQQAGNAATAAEQDTAASSSALLPPPYESSPASEDVVLHRFSPKAQPSQVASHAAQATGAREGSAQLRQKLRKAMLVLSDSDAFLDMLAGELLAVGLLDL